MKLTTDSKRIEAAHTILQQLEDEIAGCLASTHSSSVEDCESIYNARLHQIHDRVWEVIRQLNESYDARIIK